MTPAELRSTRESLGFTGDALGVYVGKSGRTVRHWETGRFVIPDSVADEIHALEELTGSCVDELVGQLVDENATVVITYRSDEDFHAAHPAFEGFPAAWHRAVVKRAASRLRGVRIEFLQETQEGP
ncbi:helix-turn-helix domain-containing protein [Streptomyces sp. NPDC056672]|uniref:helix-turn-helix domain-containing protein n=1 Tax=Streptomyces sp. NPDC056672 TaxID=3345906 RepID=UPI0036755DFF